MLCACMHALEGSGVIVVVILPVLTLLHQMSSLKSACASPILIAIMVIGPSTWCTVACLVVFYLLACRLSMCFFVKLLTALLFDWLIRNSALWLWQHWRAVQG